MKMKTVLLLFIISTMGLIQQLTAQTLNGYWSLICYSDLLIGKNYCITPTDESQTVSLMFNDNGKVGTMSGHTTGNEVEGNYIITNKNKIKVKSFGGTKIGEIDWKYNFWNAIYQSSSFKYTADTLVILFDNDTKAMKFIQLTKKKK